MEDIEETMEGTLWKWTNYWNGLYILSVMLSDLARKILILLFIWGKDNIFGLYCIYYIKLGLHQSFSLVYLCRNVP